VNVSEKGTGQGAVISPLLANILPALTVSICGQNAGRRREAKGDMIIVRYADDFIVGFEHEEDADVFWMRCESG